MQTQDQILREQLPVNYGFSPLYRLRIRFIFSDGKPDWVGGWNSTSQNPVDMACFVKKENLLMAVIEGEKIGAWTVKRLLEIDGHRYATAKWVTALTAPMIAKGDFQYKGAGNIIGLEFQTNDHGYTIFVDGQSKTRKLSEHDKKFKLKEHSTGGE